jgi:hypothetical protein
MFNRSTYPKNMLKKSKKINMFPGLNENLEPNNTIVKFKSSFAPSVELRNEPSFDKQKTDEYLFNQTLKENIVMRVQRKLDEAPTKYIKSFFDLPFIKNIDREAKLNRILKETPEKRDKVTIVIDGSICMEIEEKLNLKPSFIDGNIDHLMYMVGDYKNLVDVYINAFLSYDNQTIYLIKKPFWNYNGVRLFDDEYYEPHAAFSPKKQFMFNLFFEENILNFVEKYKIQ